MQESIIINDVGPRDGLQNQPQILSPEDRLRIVSALREAGLSHIEIGAFVSPKAVPAMAGGAQMLAGVAGKEGHYSVLIPNMKGYELARDAGAEAVVMVLYATDGMAQANVRMSMADAEETAGEILQRAREDGIEVISTISVSFECPFDGPVDPAIVIAACGRMIEAGTDLMVIADTIGAGNPSQVRSMTSELVSQHGPEKLGCHFHDTRAMGLANVFAATESGIRRFDASISGLGGCPFAPGASGNVATEDVVMMLEQMGFDTGIDQHKLMEASRLAADLTGGSRGARAKAWLDRQLNQ